MTQRFEIVFVADAEITSGPTWEAEQAAKAAENQEETKGEKPDIDGVSTPSVDTEGALS